MSTTHAPRSPLPRTVIALGWVSLLTDAASDMIYPLVPAFLLSLGGGAEALGWLEGIAELIAALLKLGSGRISDRWKRRKPLIALGYGISALARPFYALAMIPLHAVLIRAGDRVGKGLRGPARDAMVADAVPAADRGNAFGFHRMMDNFGGVLGLLADLFGGLLGGLRGLVVLGLVLVLDLCRGLGECRGSEHGEGERGNQGRNEGLGHGMLL